MSGQGRVAKISQLFSCDAVPYLSIMFCLSFGDGVIVASDLLEGTLAHFLPLNPPMGPGPHCLETRRSYSTASYLITTSITISSRLLGLRP